MLHGSHARAATSCSINSAGLAFSNYETFSSSPNYSLGSVTVQCTNLGPGATDGDTVALKIGGGAFGTVADRKMASGTSHLRYGIYSDTTYSQNWGDDMTAPTLSTGPLAVNASKPLNFILYGRIPPLQNVRAGAYSDSLLITVTP
jgi:spore coat protein U-like protein